MNTDITEEEFPLAETNITIHSSADAPSGSAPRVSAKHVFHGEVKHKAYGQVKAVGFHREGSDAAGMYARVVRVVDGPNAQGVYRAEVDCEISMKVHLFRDESGIYRAEASQSCVALGWVLEQDVQGGPEGTRELISRIERVRDGEELGWEGSFNAHTLILNPLGARIENDYMAEMQCDLPLDVLRRALWEWLKLVEGQVTDIEFDA